MPGASIFGYITIEVVLDHDYFLTSVRVSFEDALNRGICRLAFSACDVPSIKIK